MRHRIAVLSAVLPAVLLGSLAGCVKDRAALPAPQVQPAASAPVGAAPPSSSSAVAPASSPATPRSGVTPTTAVKGNPVSNDISATGFGPYGIGAGRSELAAAGLIGPVTSDAQGCERAVGLVKWGSPKLVFAKGGRLEHVTVTTARIGTSVGITVGKPLSEVKAAYPAGTALSGDGWYVQAGDFALLFGFKNGKVATIEAGTSSTLSIIFTGGPGC